MNAVAVAGSLQFVIQLSFVAFLNTFSEVGTYPLVRALNTMFILLSLVELFRIFK